DQLDDDPVGVPDLERALTPVLGRERHGDRHPLLLETGELALEIGDDERQDLPLGVHLTLVVRKRGQTDPEVDDVHPDIRATQRVETVGRHLLGESEVVDEEAGGRGGVGNVEADGGRTDLHVSPSLGGIGPYTVRRTWYTVQGTMCQSIPMSTSRSGSGD